MIERNIYHDGKLVVTRCYDTVTAKELNESQTWMIQNFGSLLKPGFSQLFNTAEADIHKITEDDIHHIAHINISFSRTRGKFSMAILAVHPYPLQLARLHKLLSIASNINVEIFSDEEKAYEWLGHDKPI